MGLIRFAVPPAALLADWPEVQRGYLSGADGRVYPTRIEVEGPVIGCRRSSSESSKFHVAWPVPGFGRPVLQTTSLPERDEPYLLPLELARGKLVQIRNQSAAWEQAGMLMPAELGPMVRTAYRAFSRAATEQQDAETSTRFATEALTESCRAAELLCQGFTAQALAGRHQRYPHLPASLGCELGGVLTPAQSDLFCAAFNAVTIPVRWTRIETTEGNYNWDSIDQMAAWGEHQRLILRGGPLIDLGPRGLPEWLSRWEHDIFNLQSFVCDFVETAIARYVGRIRLWEIAGRFNTGGALTLSEEARLSLVVRVLEVARQVDEEAQLWLRVDQPWGEYQARGQHRLSPLQVVDALMRSGVSLAGVNLEIATGYHPRGTPYRDLLDFSRLIDAWAVLGVPLHVTLAAPSGPDIDPQAMSDLETDPRAWPTTCDEAQQASWVDGCLPLLMAKPAVAGVSWANFSDADPHEFPRSGLLHPDGTPKPALERLIEYRHTLGRKG
ncbi:MAG: endo-1,4-beta-xylanase [Planctomycetaceae bacterium]|nr:endo-1,4-beta-xylanase [Planctomycetaceae bacterium]